MSTILIKNAMIVTMDSKVLQGDILIENDIIKNIAPRIEEGAEKIIYADGKMVLPGFVNAHTHIGMSLFRGMLAESTPENKEKLSICNAEKKLTREDVYAASRLSILEMIKSGTTTFCDSFTYEDEVAKAVSEMGIRAVISRCVCGDIELTKECIKEAEELYTKYNEAENGRIKVVFSLDNSRNCPPEAIRNTVELAKKYDAQVHMHYLENKDEIRAIKEKYNKTVTEYLKSNNLFDVKTVLAHGVWVDELDLAELQFHDVSIVSNPVYNSIMGSGIADCKFLLEGGINVALGTDGQESACSLDMFNQVRQCAYSQKLLYKDAMAITSKKVLEMATIKGAKALGLAGKIGTIEKGKKADLIIVDINKERLTPLHNIYSSLAYEITGGDVETTIVDGKILMEERKVLIANEEEIIQDAKKVVERLF